MRDDQDIAMRSINAGRPRFSGRCAVGGGWWAKGGSGDVKSGCEGDIAIRLWYSHHAHNYVNKVVVFLHLHNHLVRCNVCEARRRRGTLGCLWAHHYWEGGLTLESVVQRGVCLALVLLSGKVPLKPLGLGVAALLVLHVRADSSLEPGQASVPPPVAKVHLSGA